SGRDWRRWKTLPVVAQFSRHVSTWCGSRSISSWLVHCRSNACAITTPSQQSGGYRALHLWCRQDGFKVEVQLRTQRQQRWADTVEQFDTAFGTDLKHETGPEPLLRYLRELSRYLCLRDDG